MLTCRDCGRAGMECICGLINKIAVEAVSDCMPMDSGTHQALKITNNGNHVASAVGITPVVGRKSYRVYDYDNSSKSAIYKHLSVGGRKVTFSRPWAY